MTSEVFDVCEALEVSEEAFEEAFEDVLEECTDPDFGGKCYCDYVEVLDSDGSQLFKECNSEIPSPLTSTGNTMTVRFYSDSIFNFPGFRASCRGNDGSLCTITPPGSAPLCP